MKLIRGKYNRLSGFVLLELLVAMLILFGVIGLGAQIYSGSMISAETANHQIHMATHAPYVADEIQDLLTQAKGSNTRLEGQGTMWDIEYVWDATLNAQSKGPSYYDDTSRSVVESPNEFFLWQVQFELQHEGKTQVFSFLFTTRVNQ